MANKPIPAVGIDLGTTYSVIARLDESGRPQTISNVEGEKLTPSVLLFEPDGVLVGREASKARSTEMEMVAECPKRDLGQRVYHKALAGRQYPPEALQAWILNKLRSDATSVVGRFDKVVITVPAYFDEVRRKATQDAGYIAGLDVIDIINEPTAAAVAFGFQQGLLSSDGQTTTSQTILVYDLGGGTFDVTVMRLEGTDFRTLATDGDVQLGGRDWDQRLVDYVAEAFIREHRVDPREDVKSVGRLWRECEEAKHTLSARAKAAIRCESGGRTLQVEVMRQKFQELTQDLLDRTSFTTRETLTAASLQWKDVDRILLAGGSTRMPAVVEMLSRMSGMQPDRSLSPDEAVAHGAALHAGILLAQHQGEPPSFRIQNVNSHSLGVVATEVKSGRQRNVTLIGRNTPLPAAAKRVFKTQKKGQRSILVQIVEGESKWPEHCSQVGRCAVRDLPSNLPVGTPIEVRFQYRTDGRLKVKVRVDGTDKSLDHELTRENSLTDDQLEAWRMFLSDDLT